METIIGVGIINGIGIIAGAVTVGIEVALVVVGLGGINPSFKTIMGMDREEEEEDCRDRSVVIMGMTITPTIHIITVIRISLRSIMGIHRTTDKVHQKTFVECPIMIDTADVIIISDYHHTIVVVDGDMHWNRGHLVDVRRRTGQVMVDS